MTRQEQKTFIEQLTGSITNEIIEKIDTGIIPEKWDGIELRQLLVDKFNRETYPRLLSGARKREYNRMIQTTNI